MISQFVVVVRNKLQLNLARKAINMAYGKSKGRVQRGTRTSKPGARVNTVPGARTKKKTAAKKPKKKKSY
tara:strand:- start:421 stop:630 length:210 start_codon:yes stop_codon:yes gene_type:complete